MKGHDTAVWAGVSSFFASLLAIGVLDLVTPDKAWHLAGAFLVAAITGGSIYAKQRLEEAKKEEIVKSKPTTYQKAKEK